MTSSDERIAALETACRHERQLGLDGHWSYSLVRHQALIRRLRAARAQEHDWRVHARTQHGPVDPST